MADLLVDTDVCVDHLDGTRRLPARSGRLAYSVVTRCELLAGAGDDDRAVRQLLGPLREHVVDRRVADEAGRLRARLRIRTPDALIAATALVHGITLLTRNTADFRRVPDLRLRSR